MQNGGKILKKWEWKEKEIIIKIIITRHLHSAVLWYFTPNMQETSEQMNNKYMGIIYLFGNDNFTTIGKTIKDLWSYKG